MIETQPTPADRAAMLLDLQTALRKVPPGILRDLAKRRLPGDDAAEKIVSAKLLEHLELCGWIFRHRPSTRP